MPLAFLHGMESEQGLYCRISHDEPNCIEEWDKKFQEVSDLLEVHGVEFLGQQATAYFSSDSHL